jgi:hypothetical protein
MNIAVERNGACSYTLPCGFIFYDLHHPCNAEGNKLPIV